MQRNIEVLVTCEHGGNDVPPEYRALFANAQDALASHRGFDAGAFDVARALAGALGARLVASQTTRLLIDLNRSPRHPRLYSEVTGLLPADEKRALAARYYTPYRNEVEEGIIAPAVARGAFVLHVSAHSFTPVLDGAVRNADVGLLFDPARAREAAFVAAWRTALREAAPAWSIRRNYPYRGVSDGFTTHLRRRFAEAAYAGLELEVNQRLVAGGAWAEHVEVIAGSFLRAVLGFGARPGEGGLKPARAARARPPCVPGARWPKMRGPPR